MNLASAYVVKKDVVYDVVNNIELKLDIYKSKDPEGLKPAVVFFHGGCWNSGSKNDIPFELRNLADEGFVIFSVGYRLSQVAKYPAAVTDIQQAIRYIRKNASELNVNPKKIATMGLSAGGYLAAIPGVKPLPDRLGNLDEYSGRVQVVADWYGRTDFTLTQEEGFDCAVDFLGKKRNFLTVKDFKKASIIPYVDENSSAFIIVHGTNDKQVYPVHSELLNDALKERGREVELHWAQGLGHGFFNADSWNRTKEFISTKLPQ